MMMNMALSQHLVTEQSRNFPPAFLTSESS